MSQGLVDAIARLTALAGGISGIKTAPAQPPEHVGVFPFVVAYPETGRIQAEGAGQAKGIDTVIVEFHVNRVLLATAVGLATGYIETYGDLLRNDPTLNGAGTVLLSGGNFVTWEFGRLEWGGIPTIGVRFHVPVKVRRAI